MRGRLPAGRMKIVEKTELPVRHAGRVIVLDPGGRVLLFRYDDGPPNGRHWNTPGGGLEPGEDYHAGAQRELFEETGWADVPVLPAEVHQRIVTMEHSGRLVRQHERFFLARVPVGRRTLGEVAAMHTTDGIAAARWWTLAELDATAEKVWPDGLPALVKRLLS
jgi:8-oxo-dGTP pyrophosphatase MutT (NUDIX family)